MILGEGFLNYLTLLVVLPSNDLLLIIARAVIALIATIGTFKAFNWFLDAWDPTKDEESHWMMRVGSGALALAVLLVVGFVTTARARDFEGGEGGLGIVAIGFIGLSLVLPIIGGVIELHLARIRPLHSRMRKWRASLIDLRKF